MLMIKFEFPNYFIPWLTSAISLKEQIYMNHVLLLYCNVVVSYGIPMTISLVKFGIEVIWYLMTRFYFLFMLYLVMWVTAFLNLISTGYLKGHDCTFFKCLLIQLQSPNSCVNTCATSTESGACVANMAINSIVSYIIITFVCCCSFPDINMSSIWCLWPKHGSYIMAMWNKYWDVQWWSLFFQ